MRLSQAQFAQLARGKRGAIIEPGDGEVVIPALYQPVFLPIAPVETSNIIGGLKGHSFVDDLAINQVGANPGQVTNSTLTMDSGMWHLKGNFMSRFTGGVSGQYCYLNIVIPGGTGAWIIEHPFATAVSQYDHIPWEFMIHFTTPGALIQLITGATIAGDNLRVTTGYIANKIL